MLVLDYDGTLAPIRAEPSRVRLRARTQRLLFAVATLYPCVVISGRGRADLVRRLEGFPIRYMFGNHGLEPWGQDSVYPQRVREWLAYLKRWLPNEPGLTIEDKTYSLTIHYRRVRRHRKGSVENAIRDAIPGLRAARVLSGDQAVSVVPKEAPHKGAALEYARGLVACDCAIVVGDDATDEDAFRAGPPARLLSIRVGASRTSTARYYLKTQSEMDAFLDLLARMRSSVHDLAVSRGEPVSIPTVRTTD